MILEGDLVMKAKTEIEIIEQSNTHKVYYMFLDLTGLDIFERAKAQKRFINQDTKVLETILETDLRQFLRDNGIIPQDGSQDALNTALTTLKVEKHKELNIVDRYYKVNDERIVGQSENFMTILLENENLLGCSMEVRVDEIH